MLKNLIDFNSKRVECLKNRNIISTIKLLFNKKCYLSIKSYIGDLLYILKN